MLIRMQDLLAKGKLQPIRQMLDVGSLLKDRKDVTPSGPLDVRLDAHGDDGIVYVNGELTVDLELACSRCLDPVHEHLTIPFHEQFKAVAAVKGDEEESDILTVVGDKLELQPYVEEAFLLYVPFAPLCSKACKGLCPQCGTNLNEQECDCSREVIDPRLAALKDLFKE
jgi:uncharacterized protein